jgi:SanA protein
MSALKKVVVAILLLSALGTAPWFLMGRLYGNSIYSDPASVPAEPVAIVFGAGLWPGGGLSPILEDRVNRAIQLYESGKVKKILMSGDNRFVYYNEPGNMALYAVKKGVPRSDVVIDYAGRRTYDTCYRARAIFGVSDAILVTQGFHMPRALFTCNKLGVRAIGVTSDQRQYSRSLYFRNHLREVLASARAFLDVYFLKPTPVLGPKIDIWDVKGK